MSDYDDGGADYRPQENFDENPAAEDEPEEGDTPWESLKSTRVLVLALLFVALVGYTAVTETHYSKESDYIKRRHSISARAEEYFQTSDSLPYGYRTK